MEDKRKESLKNIRDLEFKMAKPCFSISIKIEIITVL